MSADLSGTSEIQALLGPGTTYEGKLTFEGRVRLEGSFSGQIFSAGTLILAAPAELDAEVEVGTLIMLGGTLRGRVVARELVELHPDARVEGELESPQLFIARGAVFDGRCVMPDDPDVPSERFPLEDSPLEEPASSVDAAPVAEETPPSVSDRGPSLAEREDDALSSAESTADEAISEMMSEFREPKPR